MGAKQSSQPRSVNISNDSPIGFIDVSADVAKRLKDGIIAAKVQNEQAQVAAPVAVVAPPPQQQPVQQQPTIVYSRPVTTTAEVERRTERALQENDRYWHGRIRALEENLKKTNTSLENEYKKAVEDVKLHFANDSSVHQLLPQCQELKSKVIECYKSNKGETLKCSGVVEAFIQGVSNKRVEKIEAIAKEQTPPPAKAAVKAVAA